jgi:hypothetical protein
MSNAHTRVLQKKEEKKMNSSIFNADLIAKIIANIPALIVSLSTILYSLAKVRLNVQTFPGTVTSLKTELTTSFNNVKTELTNAFNAEKAEMGKSFKETQDRVVKVVEDVTQEITQKVNHTLTSIENRLSTYESALKSSADQNHMLVLENKIYMDVIASMAGQDIKAIQSGVAKALSNQVLIGKKELENYPQLLIRELPTLETSLKKAYIVLGNEKFEELLRKIGYEGKKQAL